MDVAYCERRCQGCTRDFVVVGRRRSNTGLTPAIELVSCPYCRDARRVMLAPDVEGPVTAVYTGEDWQALREGHAPTLSEEDLTAIESRSTGNGAAAPDVGVLLQEVRRLRVEASCLRLENDRLLERLRKQQ